MYAAGKIPGGFFKREGRPTERAILTARMIDRPIRPLWPKGFRNEVQVICTVLSRGPRHRARHPLHQRRLRGADDLAAAVLRPGRRRARRPDRRRASSSTRRCRRPEESTLDLIVVGTKDGLTMVEAGADEIPEETLLEALELAHARDPEALRGAGGAARARPARRSGSTSTSPPSSSATTATPIWERIQAVGPEGRGRRRRRARRASSPRSSRWTRPTRTSSASCRSARRSTRCSRSSASSPSRARSASSSSDDLRALTEAEQDSKELKSAKRSAALRPDHRRRRAAVPGRPGDRRRARPAGDEGLARRSSYVKKAAEAIYKDLVRKKIAVEKRRPDGRGTEEIRPIEVEVGVNPRAHGSGLFTRGQTQIISSLTLGTAKEGQRIDDLSLETDRRYMHHYNFPPYSVGETGFMRGPKRRDIGHGALAQRALEAVIPTAGGVPVHDPHRLGDARVERLVVDGLGLRLDARR